MYIINVWKTNKKHSFEHDVRQTSYVIKVRKGSSLWRIQLQLYPLPNPGMKIR